VSQAHYVTTSNANYYINLEAPTFWMKRFNYQILVGVIECLSIFGVIGIFVHDENIHRFGMDM
jgi:hypothetical protein